MDQAKRETANLASQARDQVRDQVQGLVSQRKDQMANRLGSLAGVLRDAGRRLDEEDRGGLGRYAERAAEQVDRLSTYLRDRDLDSFVRDTETLARRRPDSSWVAPSWGVSCWRASSKPRPSAAAAPRGTTGGTAMSTGSARRI